MEEKKMQNEKLIINVYSKAVSVFTEDQGQKRRSGFSVA